MGALPERGEFDNTNALAVRLGGREHQLPWRNVGTVEKPAWIPYLDPLRPEICLDGATELARMAIPHSPTLLVAISSSKSENMVSAFQHMCATQRGVLPDVIFLQKGAPASMGTLLEDAAFTENFKPVTATEQLIMAASHHDVALLQQHATGGSMVIVDDVFRSHPLIS